MKASAAFLAQHPQLKACADCGLCLSVCPDYRHAPQEPRSPRGRLRLGLGLAARQIQAREIFAAMRHCFHCGRCQQICPMQLPLQGFFFAMARDLRGLYKVAWSVRRLERLLLTAPEVAAFLHPPAALLRNLDKKLPPKWRLRALPLPLAPYVAEAGEPPAISCGQQKVVFYAGCLGRHLLPQLASHCWRLLAALGYEALASRRLGCCGRPVLVRGGKILAGVRRNLAILATLDFKWLVSPCPACVATIKNIWPALPGLGRNELAQARLLAGRCLNLSDLLLRHGWTGLDCSDDTPVFWHRPCLMESGSVLGITGFFKEIGQSFDSGPNGACCGISSKCAGASGQGGSACGGDSPQALEIRTMALQAGAGGIITACPGCLLALKSAISHSGKDLPVWHFASWLVERMRPNGARVGATNASGGHE